MRRVLIVGTLLVVAVAFSACEGDTTVNVPADPPNPTSPEVSGITVTGTGEARGVPDILTLSLGIETSAPTVAEARSRAAEAATQLLASLKANGIAEIDIRTSHVGIQPLYEYPQNLPPRLYAYQATNQLLVTVRDLDSAGRVIDDAAKAAGNSVRVNSLQFGFDKPETLLAEARRKAIEDAIARADVYAGSAGVTRGDVEYISEYTGTSSPYPRPPATGGSVFDDAVNTPIQPGQSSVSVTVTVRFAIQR